MMNKEKNTPIEQERIGLCHTIEEWQEKDGENRACLCILDDQNSCSSIVAGKGKSLIIALCAAIAESPELKDIIETSLRISQLEESLKDLCKGMKPEE